MEPGLILKNIGIGRLSALLIASSIAFSCGSSKNVSEKKSHTTTKSVAKSENLRKLDSGFSGNISGSVKDILKDAEKYMGAPYKFGGNTSSGFDCSGFTVKVFEENDLKLPRRSSDQAETGKKIDIRDVKPGDLLFFATAGGSRVSHVGIVHDIGDDGEIKFIHASTSKGVIISSLNEKYWNKAYLHAQRVL
ncbi:cell wall-associated NlpC family hydrolase [Chryseobacterium defluvii]|uniref:Cell wall-associated NlpC family hydrolase n=1 Tax=Chryseobacterium defluvii TaxID=160396 RepID=A0A840KAJ8_9FLAO|nr:C40 family peptidase [Chryseobacterium defluvii]MBB4805455.1 cell wall-associated NlpC family hydrolase [Chryseobacterium defluvii]